MMQVGKYVFAGEYEGKKKKSSIFSGFIDYSQNRCTPPPTVHDIVILFKKYYGRRHPSPRKYCLSVPNIHLDINLHFID